MKTLWLDPFSGLSGDMVLGLLVDLGLPLEQLHAELARLPLAGWRIEATRERRHGIAGTRLLVSCPEEHRHRGWAEIDALLATAGLAAASADLARRIFRRLGEAEARVHGIPLEQVHFHEVGAMDAILDITGAAVGLTRLGPLRVLSAPVPLGRGWVETAHGRYPLPAPATLELLRGAPVVASDCERELVTPTGAAILTTVAEFAPLPALTLEAVGYGVGSRDLPDRPNLLRGLLGTTDAAAGERDSVTVLESHLDDSSPELLGHLLEHLLAQGALDAGFTPLQMKKNRPGVRLTVVAEPRDAARLARLVLHESSAIGIRSYDCTRFKLGRAAATVSTPLGEARVKLLSDGGELLRVTPEYESCRALAAAAERPLSEVTRLVQRAGDELLATLSRPAPAVTGDPEEPR